MAKTTVCGGGGENYVHFDMLQDLVDQYKDGGISRQVLRDSLNHLVKAVCSNAGIKERRLLELKILATLDLEGR